MDKVLADKERRLERLRIDEDIAEKESSISEKKAHEREMKKRYGRDWRKILGLLGKLKPSKEAMQDMYAVNPELKDLNSPRHLKRFS